MLSTPFESLLENDKNYISRLQSQDAIQMNHSLVKYVLGMPHMDGRPLFYQKLEPTHLREASDPLGFRTLHGVANSQIQTSSLNGPELMSNEYTPIDPQVNCREFSYSSSRPESLEIRDPTDPRIQYFQNARDIAGVVGPAQSYATSCGSLQVMGLRDFGRQNSYYSPNYFPKPPENIEQMSRYYVPLKPNGLSLPQDQTPNEHPMSNFNKSYQPSSQISIERRPNFQSYEYLLEHHESPNNRPISEEKGCDKFEIVRHLKKSEIISNTKRAKWNWKTQRVELKVTGHYLIREINSLSWDELESNEQRRIVRIEKRHTGPIIVAHFLVPQDCPSPFAYSMGGDFIEVSCLKCSGTKESQFFITSVEVIEVVEFLTGITGMSQTARRKERARIRSNLSSLWHKPDREVGPNSDSDLQAELLRRVMKYKTRKPIGIMKDTRFLKWDDLIYALERALLFYQAMPI